MTKDEWLKVEEALKSFFHTVKLQVDDYAVTLSLERDGIYKNCIMIYVNGTFDLKWMDGNCEECRRFLQKHEKSALSSKGRAYINKQRKKLQKELLEQYDQKYIHYDPRWKSFGSLKKHLLAENKSIELIEII